VESYERPRDPHQRAGDIDAPRSGDLSRQPRSSRDPLYEASCQDAYQQYDDESDSRVRKAVHLGGALRISGNPRNSPTLSLVPMEDIERPDEAVDQTGRATDFDSAVPLDNRAENFADARGQSHR
jgi:hypothetical protein